MGMKNLLKVMLLLSILILTACTVPNEVNMAKSEYLCRHHGGLYNIRKFSEYPVVCNNGKSFSVRDLEGVIIEDKRYFINAE